jgi:hypothetical protein
MYYDSKNPLTVVSGGGAATSITCLAWLVIIEVFPPPSLPPSLYLSFSLSPLCIGFYVELLKIQMCPPVYICFKVGHHYFDFYLF